MADENETIDITNSMEWPIDPEDRILVFLNGKIQGMVIEADADEGYLIKRTWDGCKITLKGKVRIEYNGEEASRVEIDSDYSDVEPSEPN